LIPAKTTKVFYIKIKSTEIKMGLVPRLHLGVGMEYAGNALVKNHGGKAYIKIVTTRDTDEKIVAPEVELEKLDKTATSCLKNSSPCNNDVQTRAVNAIVIDNIQST